MVPEPKLFRKISSSDIKAIIYKENCKLQKDKIEKLLMKFPGARPIHYASL